MPVIHLTKQLEPLGAGAKLYLEKDLFSMPEFPFTTDDVVNIRLDDGRLVITKAEWYETLDWACLPNAWRNLPPEIKQKITEAGHAPIDI